MTKTDIIAEIANTHLVERVINKLTGGVVEDSTSDLVNDIYVSLLEKDDETIQHLYETDALGFYVIRMVKNNLFSANSPYYRTYKKPSQNKVELTNEYYSIADR